MPLSNRTTTQAQDAPLSAKVRGNKVVIEIGIRTLAHAASYADWANPYDEQRDDYRRSFAITDPLEYANDVVHAMLAEEEDGSSPLSDFLDAAMEEAVNQGSLGTAEADVPFEQHAASETWAKGMSRV